MKQTNPKQPGTTMASRNNGWVMLRGERTMEGFYEIMQQASGRCFVKLLWLGPVSSQQSIFHPMVGVWVFRFPPKMGFHLILSLRLTGLLSGNPREQL
jgi:hypothetical protein